MGEQLIRVCHIRIMNNEIILNTPCMPKANYHCGNAVSQIVSDIYYKFFKTFNKSSNYLYVYEAWNLHGLPFEKMYSENEDVKLTYTDTEKFAESLINAARLEKSFFTSYSNNDSNLLSYMDNDKDFMQYCADSFELLMKRKYLVYEKIEGEYYLDIEKFIIEYGIPKYAESIRSINIIPKFHENTIIDQHKFLNKLYPITKKRNFSQIIKTPEGLLSLNPIFQSFLYPIYMANKYNSEYPCFLQVSSAGHGMLKWHYLRNIISLILTNKVFCKNLYLHGDILGLDGQRMSKHKNNTIKPSDLFLIINDNIFVRYVLIKSISEKDIPLQIDLARSEYLKLNKKLKNISKNCYNIDNYPEIKFHLDAAVSFLRDYKIKLSFEQFYIAIKMANIIECDGQCIRSGDNKLLSSLYTIYFN